MNPIDTQRLTKRLGRHTRLAIPFSWQVAGDLIDLEADGYTARVWVYEADETLTGPHAATVAGTTATYQMSVDDLEDEPAIGNGEVKFVCVAENGTNTLVSDAREIWIGDWDGAADYTPAE